MIGLQLQRKKTKLELFQDASFTRDVLFSIDACLKEVSYMDQVFIECITVLLIDVIKLFRYNFNIN